MPIIDKTDSSALERLIGNERLGITPIGKLRKGGEKRGDQFGQDLDYFRFTTDRPEVKAAFDAAFTATPKSITIVLVSNRADQAFETWKEDWSGTVMKHRCDGVTASMWYDNQSGSYKRTPIPCPGNCKQVGRLSFMIPQLVIAGFPGLVTLETHSDNDIRNIWNVLNLWEQRGAAISGMVWNLYRAATKISTPMGGGKRGRVAKHLVYIEPYSEYVKRQMAGVILGSGMVIDGFALDPGDVVDVPMLSTGIVPTPPEDDGEDDDYFEYEETTVKTPEPIPAPAAMKQAKPPAPKPFKDAPLSLEFFKSDAAKRAKGTQYIEMTQSQLQQVLSLGDEKQKTWAKFLLEVPADSETIDAWRAVSDEAAKLNAEKGSEVVSLFDVDLATIERVALRALIEELKAQIVDAKDVPF